jgi:tetratricopeptide (TPR) repeat protein
MPKDSRQKKRTAPAPAGIAARRPTRRPARAPVYAAIAAVVLVGALASAWLWLRAGRPAPGDGPIILISIDTLRADHLPVYGYRQVETPRIDALAREGVVFDRAYAHSPQTLPSHVSILSGRLPFETGVRDNLGFTVRPDLPLLAQALRDRGFATGGVVSSFVLRKETGIGRGFDLYDSEMPPAAPDRPMGQVQRAGMESLAVARTWMASLSSPRFFLFFHIYEPHKPYEPPARFSRFAPYDGEIAWADEIVGQLLNDLKARGLYDRATIVLLSDHGEGLGDHGEQEHGLLLYDETIRVPLIVRLPGGAQAGRRITAPVQHIDLVPTLLEWTGAKAPSGLRGRSLAPLLDGRRADLAESELYAEALFGRYHFGWSELYALTDARYRFIRAPRSELYDLQQDPGERRNLIAERPQTGGAMRGVLERLLAGVSVESQARVAKEDLERLQALGYVGSQPALTTASSDTLPDPKDKAAVLETYRHSIQLSAQGRYDEAIRLLRGVLDENPSMKDGWLQLGVDFVRAGRYVEALTAFKRLVEVDPADANSFVSVGGVLVTLGRLEEAKANAEIALEKAPASDVRAKTSACEVLVKVALARQDDEAARRYAKLAAAGDPSFPLDSYVEALLLHRQKQYERALPLFIETARRLRGHAFAIPELHYHIGDTLANLGREEEAAAAFAEEIRLFPLEIGARRNLAMLYRAVGRFKEAEQAIDGLLRASPTREGYAAAAQIWTIFGEKARADAVRAEARKRFGGFGVGSN